jgi:hypothetical protein
LNSNNIKIYDTCWIITHVAVFSVKPPVTASCAKYRRLPVVTAKTGGQPRLPIGFD